MRLAILCSGQGGQHPEMFDLARSNAEVANHIRQWNLPSADDLFANRQAQALIVGAGCGNWLAMQPLIPIPYLVAGYSVGEVTALAVAGVLPAATAVALAKARAVMMDACVAADAPQALAAVSGLRRGCLAKLLASAREQPALHVAIENGVDQCIIGGVASSLDAVQPVLEHAGATVQTLKVSVASHTPWMEGAVMPLETRMASLNFLAPRIRLLSGVSAESLVDGAAAARSLALQLTHTIRWSACMDTLAESGVDIVLELGPGAALSRMLAQRHPHIACRSVSEFRSIDGIRRWIDRANA